MDPNGDGIIDEKEGRAIARSSAKLRASNMYVYRKGTLGPSPTTRTPCSCSSARSLAPCPMKSLLVLLLMPGAVTGCQPSLLPPQPGPYAAKESRHLCDVLESAQREGLERRSLFVDVGADAWNSAKMAHAHGHPVLSFECRLNLAAAHLKHPFWTPGGTLPQPPPSVRLVPSCVSDYTGQTSFYRALDSSTMAVLPWVKGKGADMYWKARREPGAKDLARVDTVPVMRLDEALNHTSLSALGLPTRIGFIKSDTNGNDMAVMRGAARTLIKHRPLVYFERQTSPARPEDEPFFPPSFNISDPAASGSAAPECKLMGSLLPPSLDYACFCDQSDCLWVPPSRRGMNVPMLMGV